MNAIFVILAGAIILGLSAYAAYLFWLLRQQRQQQHQQALAQEQAIQARNASIFDSVYQLCRAGVQGQCDLSEIVIRVYCILDYVQGKTRIDVEQEFPAISALYHVVKEMPRGEARQQMPKKERMQHNLQRQKAEAQGYQEITMELQRLQVLAQPLSQATCAQ